MASLAFRSSNAGGKPAQMGAACLLWLLCSLFATSACLATEPVSLFGPAYADTPETVFLATPDDDPPADFAALDHWVEAHSPQRAVDMLGGNFWLLTHFRPSQNTNDWSVSFGNTWYQSVTLTILGDDGSRQVFPLDRGDSRQIMAKHAVIARLLPGQEYAILAKVQTPFFTSLPRIDVQTMAAANVRGVNETILTLGTLGLLTGLGIFVLFIGLWIGERSYLLYGLQSLLLVLGWSFYFGVPQGWLGFDPGLLNFSIWFILLSIVNVYFSISFLDLKRYAPKLRRCGQVIAILALLVLPAALIFPSLAHALASFQVTLAVTFSISAGLWALGHGVRQARFFVLAFVCVLLPGIIILPANFGLIPDIIDNADLLSLLGSGCEAMLLALALADNVKLLTDARERFRTGMQEAVSRALIDPLTGIGNRLAFNAAVKELTNADNPEPLRGTVQIAMIDLDGLKHVNDYQGHERGDVLLRETGAALKRMANNDTQVFRLGGDEFAVIAFGDDLSRQRLAKALTELDRELRTEHFPDAGISFGLRSASVVRRRLSSAELAELVREADRAMYRQKSERRIARASGKLSG